MKKIFYIFILSIFIFQLNLLAEHPKKINKEKKSKLQLKEDFNSPENLKSKPFIDFSSRFTKAAIFSALIPGSGQTYLGNSLKGIGFTLGFYGTAITAILANNNMIAREDRINVLIKDYKAAGNYNLANEIWQKIKFEEGNRDNDYDRRQVFTYTALGIWVLNMVDVLFFNEDQGKDEFSQNDKTSKFSLNFASKNEYNGVELKLILP
ncbi:MAG: DUF5683 domain-containing protein [Ignavibacteriaceae bacterium]